jgi:hypothetical protein
MKHLKTYENWLPGPQIGDYVICNVPSFDNESKKIIHNNIGQIELIRPKEFETKSYNSSNNSIGIKKWVADEYLVSFNHRGELYKIWFQNYEIRHLSKNKEELELLIQANKYNL